MLRMRIIAEYVFIQYGSIRVHVRNCDGRLANERTGCGKANLVTCFYVEMNFSGLPAGRFSSQQLFPSSPPASPVQRAMCVRL